MEESRHLWSAVVFSINMAHDDSFVSVTLYQNNSKHEQFCALSDFSTRRRPYLGKIEKIETDIAIR